MMLDGREFRTSIVRSSREMPGVREDWLRLWYAGEHQVYSHPDWIGCVRDAYGTGSELFIVVVWHHDEVVAILPMCVRDGKLQSAGAPRADSVELLCEAEVASRVIPVILETVAEGNAGWDVGCLDLVPEA